MFVQLPGNSLHSGYAENRKELQNFETLLQLFWHMADYKKI